ncbi:MAG TPA: OmpW family outer membrane protein [Ramlibacter sp.]|jgi:outer membrane protein|uniref:OmpW/AlkL family protein n=1 Tax=Ramlibacter sp. TaxID=1917967 RepID=UPI002D6C1754|nr:OmpW family outer membrane protein [Ramlibacter sp.]HZY20225.1 OmpW family outer membrane protein [Ramlibacter sp.]
MTIRFLPARVAFAAALAAGALSAQGQTAGTWMVSGGITRIAPDVSSGTLAAPSPPGTTVDIDADTRPTLAVGRMLTDHWSVEVPIGPAFKHTITGAGAIAGVGAIGTVRVLPATVFLQYRFLAPTSRIRPYAMLGATYAYFHKEHGSATLNALNPLNPAGGTGLSVESKFGFTPGLGVTASIDDRWFVDLQYARSLLRTTATLSTGQTISTKLNPDVLRVGVGMRF